MQYCNKFTVMQIKLVVVVVVVVVLRFPDHSNFPSATITYIKVEM